MAFLCLLILTLVLCVTAGDPTDSSSALKAFEREHKRYRNTVEDRQKAFGKRSEAHQQALTSLGGLYQADRSKKQVRKAQKQALEKYENELKRAESRVGSAKSRVRTADDELKSAREEEKFAREALKNQEKAWFSRGTSQMAFEPSRSDSRRKRTTYCRRTGLVHLRTIWCKLPNSI